MVELEQQRLHQARRALFEDYRLRRVSAWIGQRGTSMRPLIGPDTSLEVDFGAGHRAFPQVEKRQSARPAHLVRATT